MRDSHNIKYGDDDDFLRLTQEDVIEQIETIVSVFLLSLVAVVAISLVVGGIGIMNIMLVSVSERTQRLVYVKNSARGVDVLRHF